MGIFSMLAAAIAPGIALTVYFYLKDRYDSEPIRMVGKVFCVGVLLVFPILIIQRGLVHAFGSDPVVMSFLASGGIEEFFKWFVLYYLIYSHTEFDEPYDGIVYAVSVSLGFATLENVMYAWLNHFSVSALLLRALLPVSGHALFGVMMGYYLGRAKFSPDREKKFLWFALLVPFFWHGLFDYVLMHQGGIWPWLVVPLMVFLWVRALMKVKDANAGSPLRGIPSDEEVNLS